MTDDTILKELVKQIQEHLNTIGMKLVVDGDMGTKTYNAIVKRQGVDVKPTTGKKSWRVAKALLQLRAQIDVAAPKRNKSGDGTIGDAAHATRTSDHNPHVLDHTGQPIVTALDITHDPAHGVDCNKLAEAIIKDARVKYVIWAGRIWEQKDQRWDKYTGKNSHHHHIHISVLPAQTFFDSITPWRI